MEHILWTIINQVHITPTDANIIIGSVIVIMFGWCFKGVWNAINNIGRR